MLLRCPPAVFYSHHRRDYIFGSGVKANNTIDLRLIRSGMKQSRPSSLKMKKHVLCSQASDKDNRYWHLNSIQCIFLS